VRRDDGKGDERCGKKEGHAREVDECKKGEGRRDVIGRGKRVGGREPTSGARETKNGGKSPAREGKKDVSCRL
jgi:hypothetical protein